MIRGRVRNPATVIYKKTGHGLFHALFFYVWVVLSKRIPDRTDSANNKTRLREHPGGFDASGDDVSLVQVFGRLDAFAFQALALELTGAANGLGTLALAPLARLFEMPA